MQKNSSQTESISDESALAQEIIDQANVKAMEIVKTAQDNSAQLLAQSKAKAAQIRQDTLRQASQAANREAESILAQSEQEIRKRWLLLQHELLDQIFDSALKRITNCTESEKQQSYQKIIQETILLMPNQTLEIDVSAADYELVKSLISSKFSQNSLKLNKSEKIIGIVLRTPDSTKIIDNTYLGRLKRIEARLRARAWQILIGQD